MKSKLQELREKYGLTRKELAVILGSGGLVNERMVEGWEQRATLDSTWQFHLIANRLYELKMRWGHPRIWIQWVLGEDLSRMENAIMHARAKASTDQWEVILSRKYKESEVYETCFIYGWCEAI